MLDALSHAIRVSTLSVVLVSATSSAILPLPYALEPEERPPLELPIRDPKSIPAFSDLQNASRLREMELPHFDNNEDVLGYTPGETFQVPVGLRRRVEFWKKIYTEVTSNEAVLHDAFYPDIVYETVDITQFTADPTISYRAKMRRVNRHLKTYKEHYKARLLQLHELESTPLEVPFELFALFKKFEHVKEPERFKSAANRIRAQIGQRDRIVQGFLYGGRYFSRMMEIFEKAGLPKELTRLPLVESAFNLAARSKVGASGVWQFMRSTGKKFMRIDSAVDERNDPISATRAAAQLLRQNYEALQSWPLAITAYNHGREGLARAVRELGTNDIAAIIQNYRESSFGFASSNFYAEFLAMLDVEREYRTHFGKLMVDSPLAFEEFPLDREVYFSDLGEACRMGLRELALMNPALSERALIDKLPIPSGYLLRIPPESRDICRSGYRNI